MFTYCFLVKGSWYSYFIILARVLSDYNDEFNIGIVFFSAEEYFRSGSRKFVSSLDEDE